MTQARSALQAILSRCPKSIIHIILDNHETELHYEDIPAVLNRIDRRNFIKRRLALVFDQNRFWTRCQLQTNTAVDHAKIPALFVGIEREAQQTWFEFFENANVTIKSMTYVPIELIRLAECLCKNVADRFEGGEVLFLVLWERTQVRICVYDRGYLVLTRLLVNTANVDSEVETIAAIKRECTNTIGYMRRLTHLMQKPIHLLLVVPHGLISHLPDNLISPHHQTVFSLSQASACVGLETEAKSLEERSHLLIHQALCNVHPKLKLLPRKHYRQYQLSILDRILSPLIAIVFAGFVISITWNGLQQQKLKKLIHTIDSDLVQLDGTISRLEHEKHMDISWPEMESILSQWDKGKKAHIDMREWSVKLTALLNRFTSFKTQGLRVIPKIQGGTASHPRSLPSDTQDTTSALAVLEWSLVLESNFDSDLRQTNDTLERLNKAAGEIEGVLKSEISKRPIDISPDHSLIRQDQVNHSSLLSAKLSLTLHDPGV